MQPLNFEKLVTKTGVPVYVMHLPYANTVAAGVLVKAGTRDEIWPKEAGLAHALEHMMLQGTKRFPNQREVGAYIEDIGGIINAWTWSETTFYWNQVPANHKDRSFIILAEQLNNALIPQEKIKTEMQNIIEEIKMVRDNPQEYIDDLAAESLYGRHPLGKITLGKEESVKSFVREDFLNFKNRLYDPANYVFVAAGNISSREVLEQFEKLFQQRPKLKENKREMVELLDSGKRTFVYKKDIDQVNIRLTAPIGHALDKATKAIDIFSSMLDGGLSFPLFQKVRNELGLCYAINASVARFSDVGNFFIYIGTDAKKYGTAIDASLEVIRESKNDEKLLAKAKDVELGRLALRYESTGSIINQAAYQIFQYGRPLGYRELAEEIGSITTSDVASAVDQYLKPGQFRRVLLVPESLDIKT